MKSLGRCPDCGVSIEVEVVRRTPPKIPPHGCPAHNCEYPTCPIRLLAEEMVQFSSGAWHCPTHALLATARDLVAFYHAEGAADWTAISEIIGESLPTILRHFER